MTRMRYNKCARTVNHLFGHDHHILGEFCQPGLECHILCANQRTYDPVLAVGPLVKHAEDLEEVLACTYVLPQIAQSAVRDAFDSLGKSRFDELPLHDPRPGLLRDLQDQIHCYCNF